ncbi:hypothetical protein TIFTF001_025147 [Ficus carica]|uniref:Uncharacterized protein n=1 Tax=Ficus carica TaxID=3494 RepID=A0AA88AJA9_FICCA|nr:hypothetical protein TIFTF001_025147 [Ficus carica]
MRNVKYVCMVTACARRVVTELVSERFLAIQFHSQPAIATIIDRVIIGVVIRYVDDLPHLPYRGSLQFSLACRCLVADARLWWMTLGERAMPDRTWAHFRTLVIARFGPIPDEGADGQYRDPKIYRAMHLERYFSYVADWHAYPQESMGHYCRRFQEAMLPHIPQDIASPGMQALVILRNGLPPQIRQYVPMPTPEMTVGHMIDHILDAEVIVHAMQADAYVADHLVPIDDAGMGEPMFEAGLAFPEDPIPAAPLQEVPAPEVDIEADDPDTDDDMDAPEDPPIIDISSDDEDDGEEPEYEPG